MCGVRSYVTQVPVACVYHDGRSRISLDSVCLSFITETETLSLVTIGHQNLVHITTSCSRDFPIGALGPSTTAPSEACPQLWAVWVMATTPWFLTSALSQTLFSFSVLDRSPQAGNRGRYSAVKALSGMKGLR